MMNRINKIQVLLDSMNDKKQRKTDFYDWRDFYYEIKIIISEEKFQNIKEAFEMNLGKLLYFEEIEREDGYTMKTRGKMIEIYHTTLLDEDIEELLSELFIYDDNMIRSIGENIAAHFGNKLNHIHLFTPRKFLLNKTFSELDIHLFKEILNNYLDRYLDRYLHSTPVQQERNRNWCNEKIRREKQKLHIEEIIYRYAKIICILQDIDNLLTNDQEYKDSYFLDKEGVKKKTKLLELLELLEKIYITKKYKTDTLLKIDYNNEEIKRLENIVNSNILCIKEFIQRIRCSLNETKVNYWRCFSFRKIDKHKVYSELLAFL